MCTKSIMTWNLPMVTWIIRSSMLVWSPDVEKCSSIYASKLRKSTKSLTSTNVKCLKVHLQSCHQQHITCEICGNKNIKRHLRTHENVVSKDKIDGCNLTFSTM
ncbi:hypothetical protein Hanom_Chr16g01431851 [Helianthus anomalus]